MNADNPPSASEIETVFAAALAMPDAERASYLASRCGANAVLRERVEALLRAHERAEGFLRDPRMDAPTVLEAAGRAENVEEQIIGRYRLVRRLGEGGMGSVFLAEQQEPVRRQVALKIIKLGMDTREVIARFEAERQALAMMNHPGVARVLDAGTTGTGRPYFVMELVEGDRITEFCERNRLSIVQRLELFIKVCQAIEHAHQKGIIHRDIKPSNVLVTLHDGVPVPKVIDFGIAKAIGMRLTDSTVFTHDHHIIGTPAYMSPEQADMGGRIDARTDIYSLGVVLYEMLTGQTPFDTRELLSSGLDAFRKAIRDIYPDCPSVRLARLSSSTGGSRQKSAGPETPVAERRRLQQQIRKVQGDLDWIVMKALEKECDRRYESATALALDLERYLRSEPVSAAPPSRWYRLQKALRRRRVEFAAGAAVLLALTAGLGIAGWRYLKEREARAGQVQATQTATASSDQAARLLSLDHAGRGVRMLEENNPAGLLHLVEARRTVEHLAEERDMRTRLWAGWFDSLPNVSAVALPTSAPVQSVAFGPSHDWLATGTADGKVIIWDTRTTTPVGELATEGGQKIHFTEFSANSRLLAVRCGLAWELWDLQPLLAKQPAHRLVRRVQNIAFDPSRRNVLTWSNDGMRLAYLPQPGASEGGVFPGWDLKVWDAETGSARDTQWSFKSSREVMESGVAPLPTGQTYGVSHFQIALAPDAQRFFVGYEQLAQWDALEGKMLPPLLRASQSGRSKEIAQSLFVSADGRWLWESTSRHISRRYDIAAGQPSGSEIQGTRPVVAPGGLIIALHRDDGVQLHDMATGEPLGAMLQHGDRGEIEHVAFQVGGNLVATAGPDQTIRLWEVPTGKPVGNPMKQPGAIVSLAFAPDDTSLALALQDGTARLQPLAGKPPVPIREWSNTEWRATDNAGNWLSYSSADRLLQWRNSETSEAIRSPVQIASGEILVEVSSSPDGKRIAIVTQEAGGRVKARVWNGELGTMLSPEMEMSGPGAPALSQDGKLLAVVDRRDGSIQIWDATTGERRARLTWEDPPDLSWTGLTFSPDGRFLAASTGMKSIHIWDIAAGQMPGEPRRDRMGNTVRNLYIALSQDWKRAIGREGVVDLVDPLGPLPWTNAPPVTSIQTARDAVFSPDGRLLALSLPEGSVSIWDLVTGQSIGQALSARATQIAFSPDRRLVLTVEMEMPGPMEFKSIVRLWEVATGYALGAPLDLKGRVVTAWFDPQLRHYGLLFARMQEQVPIVTVQSWKLPSSGVTLEDMRTKTWLRTGSRLDTKGNLEVIPARELHRIEDSASRTRPAASQTPSN